MFLKSTRTCLGGCDAPVLLVGPDVALGSLSCTMSPLARIRTMILLKCKYTENASFRPFQR